jgi:hypothetical protein
MIAALFVARRGCYYGLDDVDPWDEARDARLYAGPWPVIAHPPCARWCRLAGLVEARWGHKRGDDGGCFASALASVRRWGGVLGLCGGWSCHVEQSRYGHPAKKATWLYAYGAELPTLQWGSVLDTETVAWVSWCGNHTRNAGEKRPRVTHRRGNATPPAFRDVLLSIARTARAARGAA